MAEPKLTPEQVAWRRKNQPAHQTTAANALRRQKPLNPFQRMLLSSRSEYSRVGGYRNRRSPMQFRGGDSRISTAS
jgi:hypothetical protein